MREIFMTGGEHAVSGRWRDYRAAVGAAPWRTSSTRSPTTMRLPSRRNEGAGDRV